MPFVPAHIVLAATVLAMLGSPPAARADVLDFISKIGRDLSGITQTDVLGDTGLPSAVAAMARIGDASRTATSGMQAPLVAAHVTPEGHIELVAATGERYTAGTPAELARSATVVLPGVPAGFKAATMVLSAGSLFAGPDALKRLPEARSTAVAIGGKTFPLERRGGGRFAIKVARNLALMVDDRAVLAEAIAQLWRPIDPRRLTLLSAIDTLAPRSGAPAPSAAAPVSPAAVPIETRPIDADRLVEGIAGLARRTALLTARVVGPDARLDLPSGRILQLPLTEITAAAAAGDVDLIILDTDPPRQPGGRTWLYQSVKIAGADRAAKARTFLDLLDPVAEARGGLDVSIARIGPGFERVRLTAEPRAAPSGGLSGGLSDWIGAASGAADAVAGEVIGTAKPRAVIAHLTPQSRRHELAMRLIPGIPSPAQWIYAALVVTGLIGWRTAGGWWRRLWPLEQRGDYGGAAGFWLARSIRLIAMIALFLPLAGIPAVIVGSFARARRAGRGNARPVSPSAGN